MPGMNPSDEMTRVLANRMAHPPAPPRPGLGLPPQMPNKAAVPTSPPADPGLLMKLLEMLGLGNMMGGAGGGVPPAPASGPAAAQGIVDTVGTIAAPVKKGMDFLQNVGN